MSVLRQVFDNDPRPRVLVACEFSGTVRDAFTKEGLLAISCDLLPTDTNGYHYQGDVADILGWGWDLLIAHPPCTHLAVSGARHFARKRETGEQQAAIDFFMLFVNQRHIPMTMIENPVCIMSSVYRRPDQIIQPWMFGHDAAKKTCLWLKGLPPLVPTKVLPGGSSARRANQTPSGQNKLGPSPDRWKERSKTYPGIAAAFAEQWGPLVKRRG